MNLFNFFKTEKKLPVKEESFTSEATEEILHLAKYKHNKFGNEVKEKFIATLKEMIQASSIKFRKVKLDTRIGEYNNDTFELIKGFFTQVDKMVKGEKIIVGELVVKACEDDVEIHLSYIHGQSIKEYCNRKFKNDFGNWQVYEKNGFCLSAFFSKSAFVKKKAEKRSKNITDIETTIDSSGTKRGLYV